MKKQNATKLISKTGKILGAWLFLVAYGYMIFGIIA